MAQPDSHSDDRPTQWPAGWYDDPWRQDDQRYYDGGAWTGHVRGRPEGGSSVSSRPTPTETIGHEQVDVSATSGQPSPAGVAATERSGDADDQPRQLPPPATASLAAGEGGWQPPSADFVTTPDATHVALRRRRIYLAVGGGAAVLAFVVIGAFVAIWLASDPFGDESVVAVEGAGSERDWDGLLAPQCGLPGAGDYLMQARCISEVVRAPGPTDDRGLATVLRDACNSPSVPSTDMPYRIAEITPSTPSESVVAMVLMVRLARIYCGEGESLNYDGFRSGP